MKTLRVGFDHAPPYYSVNEDGSASGLAVDILNDAARRRGITLEWIPVPGRNLDRALQSGVVDAWPAVSATPERKKRFHLTAPWLEVDYCVVSRKGAPNAPKNGRPSVAFADYPRLTHLAGRLFPQEQRVPKPDNVAVVQAVCQGAADKGFLETPVLDAVLLDRPAACESISLTVQFVRGVRNPISIASTPRAAATVDAIRSAVPHSPDEGEFSAALDRWSGLSAGETRSVAALREAKQRATLYLAATGLLALMGFVLVWLVARICATRKMIERAHRKAVVNEQRFNAFMSHSPAAAFIKDEQGRMLYVNSTLERMFGIKMADWKGRNDGELWPAETAHMLRENDLKVLSTGVAHQVVEDIPGPDQKIRRFLSVRFPFNTSEGQMLVGGMSLDLTAHKEAQDALRISEERYRLVVENAGDIIYQTDEQGHFIYCNQMALRLLGYELADVRGKSYLELVHPALREQTARFYGRQFIRRKQYSYYEFVCLARDGSERWLGQNVQLLMRDGKPCGFQAIARDITDRKLLEQKLAYEASHDSLTGLPNRRRLLSRLDACLDEKTGFPLCVSICDLDRFKQINDRYGHAAGDDVLKGFGALLQRNMRQKDMVGRLAGDEFGVLMPHTTLEEARFRIERTRDRIETLAFGAGDCIYSVSASFGIAEAFPGMTQKDILAAADVALYSAKKRGRNRTATPVPVLSARGTVPGQKY